MECKRYHYSTYFLINTMGRIHTLICMILLLGVLSGCNKGREIILISANNNERTVFGLEYLSGQLESSGFRVGTGNPQVTDSSTVRVVVGLKTDSL